MQARQNAHSRPQITFTSDFHELVQGNLVPGPCKLRYDPLRILGLDEAQDKDHVIRAFVRFHPTGSDWQGALALPAGLPIGDLADITGQGLMLETDFHLPEGCDELEAWFSCTHADGHTHWDSDFGKNYWLRFGLADIGINEAKVHVQEGGPQDAFVFRCITPEAVGSLSLRWRVTSVHGFPRQVTGLAGAAEGPGHKFWSTPPDGILVPKRATIAFDIVYSVEGRSYTDDNQGRWYIAD